jgi:peptide subunit release factor 1 (eRF1)
MYDTSLEHRVDGVIYADGSECIISLAQDDRMREIERFDIRLISQFKNGGQSANRLERIVDENRNTFIRKVVEHAVRQFYDKKENVSKISNLVIYGPSRFKDDLYAYKKGMLSKYFKTIELIAVSDSKQIDEVFEYLNQVIDPIENSIVSELQEMIDMADSRLEFGQSIPTQLKACMLEKLIIVEENYGELIENAEIGYDPDIIIIRSDKYRSWLQTYGGMIGVRWY